MMNEWILSSSILIAAVLAVRFLLRGRISLRLQYALWAVVLVRLLLPVQIFTSDFSAGAIARNVDISEPVRQIYVSANENRYEQAYDEAYSQVAARYATAGEQAEPVVIEEETRTQAQKAVELDLTQLLYRGWLAGMLVMAVIICACNFHLSLKLRRQRREYPAGDCVLPVYLTDAVPTPCIFGLFRPAVYLTSEAAKDDRVCKHVLTHELTHYRHFDHIWSVLRSVCLVLHWYNPLVWAAAKVSRADAELACDEGALKSLGEDHRGDYGRTLIGLTCADHIGSVCLTATTMTGSAGSIRERIKLLMKRPRNTVLTLTTMLLLVTLIVGCSFSGAPETTTEPPAAETVPKTTAPAETEPTQPPEETNILRQFILPPNTSGDGEFSHVVYDAPYNRDQIKSITIVDTLADAPEECWDASEERNGAVLVWVELNGDLFDLYIGAEGGVWAGGSARNMFRGYTNVERIDFGDAFHTEGVRDMYGMFLGCESLLELDLSGFDTSHVTSMSYLFRDCDSLTELDLSHFDMSNVSGDYCTYKMFYNCPAGSEWKHLLK